MTLLRRIVVIASPLLVAVPVTAQKGPECWNRPPSAGDTSRSVAARAARSVRAQPLRGPAPVIDGKLTEDQWCEAEPLGDFVQSGPAPGALATLPSTARILFDDAAVYVAVRLWDPHPDSIVAPFPRRDVEVTSDWVFVEIDTRFDRRSGFSFGLNPRGVQVDGSWWDDVSYDPAWNGVWQGAAVMDADGWTAEFRIPFSQLALARSEAGGALTWGLNIYRHTPHRGETSNWSPRLPSVAGVVSRFNHLEGVAAPPRGTRMELVPYASVTQVRAPAPAPNATTNRAGGDIRIRPTPSTTALVSVRPDFGQVEADPSQVNLTTYETFLTERRPVFVEGGDVFQFPAGLAFSSRGTSFTDENPFYSRRVGRAPQAPPPSDLRTGEQPVPTTVLAAGRFSARSSNGWSGGAFHAWTQAERKFASDSAGNTRSVELEPLTSYTVGRLTRESHNGNAALGLMATAVNRVDASARLDSLLPRTAVVIGTDARKRSGNREVTAFVLGSRVAGSASAVSLVRAEPRHGYDRGLGLNAARDDTTHRDLTGLAAQARVSQTTGNLKWGAAGRIVTSGFEANDAGFQRNANWLLLAGDWTYQRYRVGSRVRHWSVGSDQVGVGWTTAGDRRAAVAGMSLTSDLSNYWGGAMTAGREFPAADPEVLRGGPALLLPARDHASFQLHSDTRRAWQLTVGLAGEREPTSGSHRASVSPSLDAFVTDRLQIGITPEIGWVREGWQYVGQPVTAPINSVAQRRYLLGQLDQREVSLTTRATQAFSPHLTLQWYAQAFLSSGQYGGFSEVLARDRVGSIAASRLQRDPASGGYVLDPGSNATVAFPDPAFADRSLHLNAVLRWEFLPGSTAFLVWTQERGDPGAAPFRLGQDWRRLTRTPAANALQLKVSYWIAP